MNGLIFYDVRFESQYGDSYEMTTMLIDKAVSLYNRLKGMKKLVVVERTINERHEVIETDITKEIENLNNQWNEILTLVQR